jgi:SAM-dependent methyltransferase
MFDHFRQFVPVSSDIRILDDRFSLGFCSSCGLLQKIVDPLWRDSVAKIYSEYSINHQSHGSDPFIFNSLYGKGPRALILVSHLASLIPKTPRGDALDIGCANGNILARFAQAFPEWSLYGMENSDRWREHVSSIPGVKGFFTSMEELKDRRFDLIIMSHVLEHISDPISFLRCLHPHLKVHGKLFIAVPDIRQNPIDLLVMDHCSHFDEGTLARALVRSLLTDFEIRSDILGKEIIAVAGSGNSPLRPTCSFLLPLDEVAVKYSKLFQDIVSFCLQLRANHPRLGLMGTSTAAAWVTGELHSQIDFYVDEDVQRIGSAAFGKSILSLDQVQSGSCVFIPMSIATARSIISRTLRKDIHFSYLPWNNIDDVRIGKA